MNIEKKGSGSPENKKIFLSSEEIKKLHTALITGIHTKSIDEKYIDAARDLYQKLTAGKTWEEAGQATEVELSPKEADDLIKIFKSKLMKGCSEDLSGVLEQLKK